MIMMVTLQTVRHYMGVLGGIIHVGTEVYGVTTPLTQHFGHHPAIHGIGVRFGYVNCGWGMSQNRNNCLQLSVKK